MTLPESVFRRTWPARRKGSNKEVRRSQFVTYRTGRLVLAQASAHTAALRLRSLKLLLQAFFGGTEGNSIDKNILFNWAGMHIVGKFEYNAALGKKLRLNLAGIPILSSSSADLGAHAH
jgi:hypothetical protein